MEKIQVEQQIEKKLKPIFHSLETYFKKNEQGNIQQILNHEEYLKILWYMNMLQSSSSDVKKAFKLLKRYVLVYNQQNYQNKIQDIIKRKENSEIDIKNFIDLFNKMVQNYNLLIKIIGRIFYYADKRENQICHFLDDTSKNLCKKIFFEQTILPNSNEFCFVFKISLLNKYFTDQFKNEKQIIQFYINLFQFLKKRNQKADLFYKKIIDTFIDSLKFQLKNLIQSFQTLSSKNILLQIKEFLEVIKNNLSFFPEENQNDFLIQLNIFFQNEIVLFTKQLLGNQNNNLIFQILDQNDFDALNALQYIMKYDRDEIYFLKIPLIKYVENQGKNIIQNYLHKENENSVIQIFELLKKITLIIKKVFNNNSQLIFARNKGIENFINCKINIQDNYKQVLIQKLIKFSLEFLQNYYEELQQNEIQEIELILELVSFLNTKIYFQQIENYLIEQILRFKYIKNLCLQDNFINSVFQKFGEQACYILFGIQNSFSIQKQYQKKLQEFIDQCLTSYKTDFKFNVFYISSKDIKNFSLLNPPIDFKFFENIIETFFYKNPKNEKKALEINYEQGFCELEVKIKDRKINIISNPIVIMILMTLKHHKKTVKEILTILIKELPKKRGVFYQNYFSLIFKKLVENQILIQEGETYQFNCQFNPPNKNFEIFIDQFQITNQKLLFDELQHKDRKHELQANCMFYVKKNKKLYFTDLIQILQHHQINFTQKILQETLDSLIEKDLLQRSNKETSLYIYKV